MLDLLLVTLFAFSALIAFGAIAASLHSHGAMALALHRAMRAGLDSQTMIVSCRSRSVQSKPRNTSAVGLKPRMTGPVRRPALRAAA